MRHQSMPQIPPGGLLGGALTGGVAQEQDDRWGMGETGRMTYRQAADALGVSRSTLHSWLRQSGMTPPGRRGFSEEELERLRRSRERPRRGLTLEEAALELGVSIRTVRLNLKRLAPRRGKRKVGRVSSELLEQLRGLQQAGKRRGLSGREAAETLEITEGRLASIIRRYGLEKRPGGWGYGPELVATVAQILERERQGLTVAEACSHLGISRTHLYRLMRRVGGKPRGRRKIDRALLGKLRGEVRQMGESRSLVGRASDPRSSNPSGPR